MAAARFPRRDDRQETGAVASPSATHIRSPDARSPSEPVAPARCQTEHHRPIVVGLAPPPAANGVDAGTDNPARTQLGAYSRDRIPANPGLLPRDIARSANQVWFARALDLAPRLAARAHPATADMRHAAARSSHL